MNRILYSLLLAGFLFLPVFTSAQDACECAITSTADPNQPDYSPGCDDELDICKLTLGPGLGDIDLYQFLDLRNVEVTIGDGTYPNLDAEALVSSGTYFDVLGNNVIIDLFAGASLESSLAGILGANSLNSALLEVDALLCLGIDIDLVILLDLTVDVGCTLAGVAVLPVTLVDYSAEPKANTVELNWTTAEERDNDYFRVLHSVNGRGFSPLTTIPGRGTTGTPTVYSYEHRVPSNGTNYYRLEQVDYDGTTTDLGVRSVELSGPSAAALSVYPNPASRGEQVKVMLSRTGEASKAQVYNLAGRQVGEIAVSAAAGALLPPNLPAGIYTIQHEDATTKLVLTE